MKWKLIERVGKTYSIFPTGPLGPREELSGDKSFCGRGLGGRRGCGIQELVVVRDLDRRSQGALLVALTAKGACLGGGVEDKAAWILPKVERP